eukprot:Nitzschia sp. Nitz4//scaffold15_size197535//104398//105693//NITZ4_001585-RA/size197535-processed-gene-0.77-mRNA-1//-1//CDS//3329537736//1522//frame0
MYRNMFRRQALVWVVILSCSVLVRPSYGFAPFLVPLRSRASGCLVQSTLASTSLHQNQESLVPDIPVEHNHCQEPGDRDILIRAARGEKTERTPVWLMRQAGRYMSSFREYSDKYGFRERSETPEMAVPLSLFCHRKFGMDGIIWFSDILTPLPVLGVEFDVVSGVGPLLKTSIQNVEDVQRLVGARTVTSETFDEKLPFVKRTLGALAEDAQQSNTSLIGFIGAPFTLAAYILEGRASRHCMATKRLLLANEAGTDETASRLLEELSELLGRYASYQVECGAQVIQIFESWAHHLSPAWFERWAKPAVQRTIQILKERHPTVPIIYFANGGSSFLELQRDIGADMISVDWQVDMAHARKILGDIPVSGNIDPYLLRWGSRAQIEASVRECIDKAGGPGNGHILNLGHGVLQGTPEVAVQWMVDEAKRYRG